MFEYNKQYLETFRRYREIMNTEILIFLTRVGDQPESPIFKLKGIPKNRTFFDGQDEIHASEVLFFIDELETATSYNLDGNVRFPVSDIKNRVKIMRFNGMTYYVESKNINFFDNIVKFSLQTNT